MKFVLGFMFVLFCHAASAMAKDCAMPDQTPVWQIAGCEIGQGRVDTAAQSDIWDMLMALNDAQAVAVVDWELETEDILWQFGNMLRFTKLPPLTPEEEADLTRIGDAAWGESVPMADMEPGLEALIDARGGRLLYIHTGSDSYVYAVVSDCLYRRWSNVAWAEGFASIPVTSEAQRLAFEAEVVSNLPRETCGGNS